MKRLLLSLLVTGTLLTAVALAEDAKEEAIKKDRQRIEGLWRVVSLEIDGKKSNEEDARKLTVVNGADGTWNLRSGDMEIGKGSSTVDPTKKPKTIDFTPTEGNAKGDLFLGIYKLGKNKRELCFAPAGEERPTTFSSNPGTKHIYVTFEREKAQ